MNKFTNFDDLIKYLKNNNYGKEAIQSFLFSMYGVYLTNENGIKSSLVISDNGVNVTLNVSTTLPEVDITLILDNNKWIYRVYITSDYGEGYTTVTKNLAKQRQSTLYTSKNTYIRYFAIACSMKTISTIFANW